MKGLPSISGLECVDALNRAGYKFVRQKGNHIILRRDEPFSQITVPEHKSLDRGTLRAITRQSGLSIDEFNKLLR
ncbi:MAG: type II toxin-antitoxin system HicA family toxin [Candidatus Kapabacteria bacterium]|nr:type II toxin-antitoxin system HicA family toxin [Candidatus Kapabacteria bacterium]